MTSLIQWTWIWANSGRQWRTGKPGVLQSMGSKRIRPDWANEQQHPPHMLLNLIQDSKSPYFLLPPGFFTSFIFPARLGACLNITPLAEGNSNTVTWPWESFSPALSLGFFSYRVGVISWVPSSQGFSTVSFCIFSALNRCEYLTSWFLPPWPGAAVTRETRISH